MSPRRVIESGIAHCFEGALFAAGVLAYHGQKPLILDFQTTPDDEDHVVTLFLQNGYWGAISKTNHSILRYRDPVYSSPRELALTFFHEYFLESGKKTLRRYSQPFDLSRYAPEKWVTAGEDLFWLVDAIDGSRHFPLVPKKNLRHLRTVSSVEVNGLKFTEWSKHGKKKKYKYGP